jgi:hypothetical protein
VGVPDRPTNVSNAFLVILHNRLAWMTILTQISYCNTNDSKLQHQWLALLLRIWVVTGSNFDPDTGYEVMLLNC